jgi:hypothetical protein
VRITGWLVAGRRLPVCGHSYLQDLPAGHGLVYPTTLDRQTGDVIDPGTVAGFSDPLRSYWE